MGEGTAVQVVVANDDHSFTLDEPALRKILLKVKDRKVIVLSIAGAFRKGKSFLLNFILRYLHEEGSNNWMGDPRAPLKGFKWRGGAKRDTTGILLWSHPFEVTLPSGETACVLLMDTQGAFDCQSTVKEGATVFALSTMLSSVQVFNVTSNIQEDDLQHLQYFTNYGQLALEGSTSKSFQDLYFLVRDWQWPSSFEYGWKGGEALIEKRLETTEKQHADLTQLRLSLRSCFAKIGCCLLPYPGEKVATNEEFDGHLSDIKDNFKLHVKEFVSSLLAPDNLVVKKFNGTEITGKELFEYFKQYVKIFNGDALPEPMSVLEATTEANNQAAVRKAMDHYTEKMESVCGGDKPHVEPEILQRQHERYRQESVVHFQSIRKMGGEARSRIHQEQLEEKIDESFVRYDDHNSTKISRDGWQLVARVAAGVAGVVATGAAGVVAMGAAGVAGVAGVATEVAGVATEVAGVADVVTEVAAAVMVVATNPVAMRALQQWLGAAGNRM